MLNVRNLTKKYGKKVTAVSNVSFDIHEGEMCVLLGPNGAGKSTTIKSIAGLLKFQGEIYINGQENREVESKRIISYVPETPALYDLLTVREHIEFILRAYKLDMDEAFINKLLDRFDMDDKQDKLGSELSKGMRQKLSIILGLITRPRMILFDEPMIGLDPKAIKELKLIFKELTDSGCMVLVSTHIIDSIMEEYSRVLIMKESDMVGSYTREEIDGMEESLEEVFFRLTMEEASSDMDDPELMEV